MVERSQRPDGSGDTAGWAPPDTPPSAYGAGLAATDRPADPTPRPADGASRPADPAPWPADPAHRPADAAARPADPAHPAAGGAPRPPDAYRRGAAAQAHPVGAGQPGGGRMPWPGRQSWPAAGRSGDGLPPPAAYPPGHARPGPPPGWAATAPTWPPAAAPGTGRPAWPSPGVPWPQDRIGPPRPYYREPHPIRARAVWAGIGSTVVWFGMFAAISWSARAYAWSTLGAAALALLAAIALLRYGDRGVAVGVAATAGCCLGIAGIVAVVSAFTGHWLLW